MYLVLVMDSNELTKFQREKIREAEEFASRFNSSTMSIVLENLPYAIILIIIVLFAFFA